MFNNLIIYNNLSKDTSKYIINYKQLFFFFKFFNLAHFKSKYKFNLLNLWRFKIIFYYYKRIILPKKKKRYKKYNYFKFSILKYTRFIKYKYWYSINRYITNYKYNWNQMKPNLTYNNQHGLTLITPIYLHINKKSNFLVNIKNNKALDNYQIKKTKKIVRIGRRLKSSKLLNIFYGDEIWMSSRIKKNRKPLSLKITFIKIYKYILKKKKKK